jgi:hypothetical protein
VTHEDIWSELETAAPAPSSGYVIRRIVPDARCDLYLGVTRPANQRMLLLHFQSLQEKLPGELPAARGLEVSWRRPEPGKEGLTLQLALLDRRFAGMFSQLVADLVEVAVREPSDVAAATACIQRLERWQRFLERAGDEGLGREAQQGLYGELWFLRERLLRLLPARVAVQGWRGPTGAAQDYQLQGCAIEVKTTAATEPRSLLISNERQLDESRLRALFLLALSVEVRVGAGETLNAIVDTLRTLLQQRDGAAQDRFEELLLEAGYLQAHAPRYEGTGYTVREVSLFRVRDGFPRITGSDLVSGVGDVHYSIALAACRPFVAPDDALRELMAGVE